MRLGFGGHRVPCVNRLAPTARAFGLWLAQRPPLKRVGLKPVVVHGGAPEITRTLEKLGERSEFVDGMRVTDEASLPVVEMVLTGKVNQ